MSHRLLVSAALVSSCLAFACGAAEEGAESQEDDATRTTYVDMGQFLEGDAYEQWFEARRGLERGFDDICGDTFCGGDWSNLYSLGVQCSVSSKIGKVRECAWTFAGSNEQVDAATGRIDGSVAFFECRIKPGGKANELVAALATERPLWAPIPSLGGQTFYDQLGECLNAPTVNPALPEPTDGTFVDLQDTLQGDAYETFFNAIYQLRAEFDEACGDSWCEGEYTNLQPLRLRCSQDDAGRVGECLWSIAASDTRIKSDGFHKVTPAPFTCHIPVDGTVTELVAALDPADEGRLLDRPLPGTGKSLGDALSDCL